MQWSYDLLDADEKTLLIAAPYSPVVSTWRGACAVAGSDDDLATLDLLDALVRKSLLVADPSAGRTRFSMLETIRRFAEAQLGLDGSADEARTAHARYFADREADVFALWNSPRQREAYTWFSAELANLRAAFRWAADDGDLDCAATIAFYSALLGTGVEQHEPFGWAEELIGRAERVDHRRLAQLYVIAALCYYAGRASDASKFVDAARSAIESGRYDEVPYDIECSLGAALAAAGQPEQWAELCRNMIARGNGPHINARCGLVSALVISDCTTEAIEESEGLPAAAEAAGNPLWTSFAFFAYGIARRYTDPAAAYDALSRGMRIAQDSGNRQLESSAALSLALLAFNRAQPLDAFDKLTLAIRTRYDAGSFSLMDSPLAILAAVLDQLGRCEPAATVTGKAVTPMTRRAYPVLNTAISHLREVLGDQSYEALARTGAEMSNAAMAAYALEQIELARADLTSSDGAD